MILKGYLIYFFFLSRMIFKLFKNVCGFLINIICWWYMFMGFVCVNYNMRYLKNKK